MSEKLLSVADAAKKLGVRRCRIYVWILQGRIPTTKVPHPLPHLAHKEVVRIKESDCIIPKAKKPGPKKDPNAPRLKPVYPNPNNPKPVKKKKPKRNQPVELK